MKSYPVFAHLLRTGCALSLTATALAVVPVVKTVPWVASNPLIPHSTYSGKTIRLKGTCDQQGSNFKYSWDFGDASPPTAQAVISNKFAIETTHVYSGTSGTVFTARLTVQDMTTGETGNKAYYVLLQDKSLDVEVNIAIDEGLWYLHKTQNRFTSGAMDFGDWMSGSGYATQGYYGTTCANVNAFEVNGHKETGDTSNPYTETVQRGMRRIFQFLSYRSLPNSQTNPLGSFNPDSNGNGIGIYDAQSTYYQGGMFMDVIVASGTPNAITTTGGTNIIGRAYKDIVQDMVDDHAWAQYDASPGGGWRYSPNSWPDNSACQWAAIGLIAADRQWGLTVPVLVKRWNVTWLAYSQTTSGSNKGAFGYTSPNEFPWGPNAVTPSGMVQMVMDGIGRGGPNQAPNWDWAETFVRDRFLTASSGPTVNIKDYYYGLLSFVKSMLLHRRDIDNDGVVDPDPIVMLQSQTANTAPIDWYAYEGPTSTSPHGVARTLVGDQNAAGYWSGHNYSSQQYPFETAWAIMMLHRTLFESGVPVAVAKSIPNPAVAGQLVTLDGSDSYHQDQNRSIVSWQWDLDSNGTFETTGPFASRSFPAVGNYPIKLRITDNGQPAKTAETTVTVMVNTPPLAPSADAGGPYVFCPEAKPWFVDGRRSVNPDEGRSEPAKPGDTIQSYLWDLDGDGQFDDASGQAPNVTAFFEAKGPGTYLIYLKVTDTSSTSYPSSGSPDLSSVATGQVLVQAGNCHCVELAATPLLKEVKLTWDAYQGMDHYNIYRSTVSGGPYVKVGSVPAVGPLQYVDSPGVLNLVYYYVVRPAMANDDEICQSNQASAEPLHPIPTVDCVPTVVSNTAKYYYTLKAASQSFGRNQLSIYIGDTASGQVAGPYSTEWLVYIRTNLATPSVRAGNATVKAYVMTKGSAKVWAVDPIGQASLIKTIP